VLVTYLPFCCCCLFKAISVLFVPNCILHLHISLLKFYFMCDGKKTHHFFPLKILVIAFFLFS
jgi:hypothetical protein